MNQQEADSRRILAKEFNNDKKQPKTIKKNAVDNYCP
jgi:hypothetical protein